MVCKKCGNSLNEGDQFCPACGAAVGEPTEGEPQKAENVCKKCGNPLHEGDMFCPSCGERCAPPAQAQEGAWSPSPTYAPPQSQYGQGSPAAPVTVDRPSGGFFALGFFFPLVGLILFLVWKDQLPLRAKSCGKGALVGVIVQFVFGFIFGIIIGVAGASQYAGAAVAGMLLRL